MGVIISVLTIVLTLVLVGAITWVILAKTKADSYEGIVVSKGSEEVEGAQEFSSTSYFLNVKTNEGQTRRIRVGKKIWQLFAEGDKIIKEKGKYNPVKG